MFDANVFQVEPRLLKLFFDGMVRSFQPHAGAKRESLSNVELGRISLFPRLFELSKPFYLQRNSLLYMRMTLFVLLSSQTYGFATGEVSKRLIGRSKSEVVT